MAIRSSTPTTGPSTAIRGNSPHPTTARSSGSTATPKRPTTAKEGCGLAGCRGRLCAASPGWEQAWSITRRSFAYTCHTLLPEALETWPVPMFEQLLPRHLEIIYAINHFFLDDVRTRLPGEDERIAGCR